MPYETGTTTSFSDLRTRIHIFLQANGWTLTGNVIHRGNVYAKLRAYAADLLVDGGQGESGGELTAKTPEDFGRLLAACWGTDISFPCTYHFFVHTNPDLFLCVINYATLNVQWLTFGELAKFGTWNGGQYFGASYCMTATGEGFWEKRFHNYYCREYNTNTGLTRPLGIGYFWAARADDTASTYPSNMNMVCDIDGSPGDWIDNHGKQPGPRFNGSFFARDTIVNSPNSFNSQTILMPVHVYASRPDAFCSLIGHTEHTRYCNVKHHDIGDILTLGAEKWMVFPHHKKSNDALNDSSQYKNNGETGLLGFAVRYDGP